LRKIELGKTGEKVSILCLGTAYFGSTVTKDVSFDLLDRYLYAGGMFIDTANKYACWVPGFKGGESETVIGEWLKKRNNRSNVFIASKMGLPMSGTERGLSKRQIEEECNKSLKRLNINTIDLYYAHADDRFTPLEETMEAFEKLIKAGKIRHIGASNYFSWRLAEANRVCEDNGWTKYCCIEQRHSYLKPKNGLKFANQVIASEELIDYCREKNVTLLAYSPLLKGAYFREDREFPDQYLTNNNKEKLEKLKSFAIAKNIGINQLLLSWLINNNPQVIPLIAASNILQLEDNLKCLEVKLTAEEINELNDESIY